ncbi:MAG: hypothetical protein Kow00108_05720 [Calditrichia bacterium]
MKRKIYIFDTTLRDGEQSPGCSMTVKQKVRMAKQLETLGVDIIEAGFPIASDGDFEAVKAVAEEIRSARVAALCRANTADIDRAWEAIKHARRPRIHTFIASSDIHMKYKLNKTREQVLEAIHSNVLYARRYTDDIEFSAEDASRSDPEFLKEVVRTAIGAGATTINLPDTVGYATPVEYGNMFAQIKALVPEAGNIRLSAHTHDDLGMAVANALAAVENGADQVEVTINGIGERAGNAALEEVVMALTVRKPYFNADVNVKPEHIFETSQLLSSIIGVPVPPNKAIVGRNAFAHESGIHQDGVLKNAMTYEIMTPQMVGVSSNKLVIGKHSGRHAVFHKCREFGFSFNKEQLEIIYQHVMKFADGVKEVTDGEFINIITRLQNEEFEASIHA